MSLKRNLITFGIAVAALAGSTIAALAVPAYATANVNVRSGPGPGYERVDVLHDGEDVDIDYCRGSWCFVIKSGPDGWVHANYLSRDGYYDDDDFYDDEDGFYLERPYRRGYWYGRPSSRACVGGPNATFCISN